MSDDWMEDPKLREWARSVREDLVPKLRGSAVTLSIVPVHDTDVKFAVELGMSIMLDKPIMLIVRPGTKVPDHLVRVADSIVEVDLADPSAQSRVADALARLLRVRDA